MLHRFHLSQRWNPRVWPYSQAPLKAKMSINVTIDLRDMNYNHQVLAQQTLGNFRYTYMAIFAISSL